MNKTIKYSMKLSICVLLISSFYNTVVSQNITNTLGTLGIFRIKDNSTTFLSMDQSTGVLSLNRNMNLLNSTSISTGVIMKNSTPFIHDFTGAGTDGNNTFIGVNSGNFSMGGAVNTYGSYNTALGKNTMIRNTTGSYNTSIGYLTLNQNTTGLLNTAVGTYSMNLNVTGSFNTTLGASTLNNNTTGSRNIAIGTYSLINNTTGFDNLAIGYQSQFSGIDNNSNTSVGNFTLNKNAAYYNSAFGFSSLRENINGLANCAFGNQSLLNNSYGSFNCSFGSESMITNTYGDYNCAFGYISLYANTTGYQNSAFGSFSMSHNTTGNFNSSFGYGSLDDNTIGIYNCSFGSFNMNSNTSGNRNVSFGSYSLALNTTGSNNSAFGTDAGNTITTGTNLTVVGYNSQPSSSTATNQITLGNNLITSLRCNVTSITSLSDVRDKKNIKELSLGLNFISKLKPRLFNWDKREWYDGNVSDGSKMQQAPTAGFIAQELDSLQQTENAEWLNLVLKDNPEKLEATTGNLLPIMVKAIQELKEKCDRLEKENSILSGELSQIELLKTQFEDLEGLYNELSGKIREKGKDLHVTETDKETNRE